MAVFSTKLCYFFKKSKFFDENQKIIPHY